MRLRAALAALCAATLLLTASSRAHAYGGELELVPCFFQNVTNQAYGAWSPIDGTGQGDWSLSAACPSHVQLQLGPAGVPADGSWRGFDFPAANSAANTIKSVSFDLLGGNGSDGALEQAVFICSPAECSSPVAPAGSNVTYPVHYSFAAAALPSGANRVRVAGRCPAGHECSAARALSLKNLDIVFSDKIKPTITHSEIPADRALPPLMGSEYPNPTVWHSLKLTPFVRYDVVAADYESGVQLVEYDFFRTDTFPPQIVGRYWKNQALCGTAGQYKIGALCPHELSDEIRIQPLGAINNYGIREGLNLMRVVSYDAAQNTSDPIETWFLVDSIAPTVKVATPLSSGTRWQAKAEADVTWQNSETGETDRDSGLAKAGWSVRDASTGEAVDGFRGSEAGARSSFDAVPLPGDGVWDVSVETTDRAGNASASGPASTTRIGVDSTVLEAPRIDPVPVIAALDEVAGVRATFTPPADTAPSGICGYVSAVDQAPGTEPEGAADLAPEADSVKLIAGIRQGVNYLHLRAISCAGVLGAVAHREFDVDTEAPQIVLSEPGPAGWYSEEHPLIASIVDGDPTNCSISAVFDPDADDFVAGIQMVAPMIGGEQTLRATATDGAGNSATLVTRVLIDLTAPDVRMRPRSTEHPAVVVADTSDADSGISSAALRYRAAGSGEWHALAPATRPASGGLASLTTSAQVPDAQLPPGMYEFQAIATDQAGHIAFSAPSSLRLPLRSSATVSSGFLQLSKIKGGKQRSVSRDFALVTVGKSATLNGRLVAESGEALDAAPIEIRESGIGIAAHAVATVSTDARGEFSYRVGPGVSRRVTARFAGDETHLPAESTAKFLVEPRVTLRIRQKRGRQASRVRFAGRVFAPGATPPKAGLPVRIEFDTPSDDKLVSFATKADAAGRFSVSKSIRRQSSPLRFSVRAVVPWFNGWPYEEGRSTMKGFVVR